jgi:hypothetical protein
LSNPDFQDGVGFLVSVKEPGRTVRVNITLTEQQLREIDQNAGAGVDPFGAFLVKLGLKMG